MWTITSYEKRDTNKYLWGTRKSGRDDEWDIEVWYFVKKPIEDPIVVSPILASGKPIIIH